MLGAIGRTPVIRLERLAGPDVAEVWVKLENANPTGSYKDRMALAMIEGAERSGRLKPGQTVVEYTGGSTGSSLAFVCAVKGYKLRIVTSDAFAAEKLRTMRAFGAELEVIPSPEGITGDLIPSMMRRAARSWTKLTVSPRISSTTATWSRAMPSSAASCSTSSTGASTRSAPTSARPAASSASPGALRSAIPDVYRVIVEPAESPVISGGEPGTHRIEGGGVGFWPPLLTRDDFEEVIPVSTADAMAMAKRVAADEGLLCGPSTGANITVALELAGRLGPGKRVVTTNVDSGLKYLAGHLYAG